MVNMELMMRRLRRRIKGTLARLKEPDPFGLEKQPEEPSPKEYYERQMLFYYVDLGTSVKKCCFDHESCPEGGCGPNCLRYLPGAGAQGGMEMHALVFSSRMGKLRGLIRDLSHHNGGGMQHQYLEGLKRSYAILTGQD